MAQDKATINLYINNEQAKGAIAELDKAYKDLKNARKAADAAGDNQLSLELQAQELSALQKLRLARKGILDIEKSMESLTKVNVRQLHLIRKNLSAQMLEMNQDSEEFLDTQKKLLRVEEQIASARGRNANSKGLGEAIKNAWSNVMPSVGLLGVFTGAIALFKSGVSEIWNLTKTIQGDSKRAMTVFGDQLGYVEMQADKLSKKMGVTNREFVSMTTGVADLLVPLDFTREKAAAMAVDVQKLAGALNEWTAGKIGVQGVSDILTKAMLGETEGLKQLGIAIRMDSEEYKTLVKQKEREGASSTAQAQSLAILELLYKKSADAQTAYNSSGNELLRFQNSAARGWRAMTESIAEWFAYSVDERMDKQVRTFNALNAEFESNEKTLGRLMPVYTDLSSKTNLNENEQKQLREAIDGIVQIIPYAASEVDKYGKALGLNTKAVGVFRESQRLLRLEMQKDVVSNLSDKTQTDLKALDKAIYDKRIAERNLSNMSRYTGESGNRDVEEAKRIEMLTKATVASQNTERQVGKTITTMRGLGLTTSEIMDHINNNWELNGTLQVTEKQISHLEKTYTDFVAATTKKSGGSDAINSLIEKKKAELKEVEKMSEATEAELIAKNKKREELNAELKRLQGLGVSNEKPKSYSLDTDEKYLAEKSALKERRLKGDYSSEDEYSRALLALEIRTLEDRIATNRDKGEDLIKLKGQLLDRQLTQAKDAQRREEELRRVALDGKIASGGEAGYEAEREKARRERDERLKALALTQKAEHDMTVSEKEAKLAVEREYSSKLVRLDLTRKNKEIARLKTAAQDKVAAIKQAQDKELSSADTLEKKKAILKQWYSDEELRNVTSSEEAVKLIRAKYADDQNAKMREELTAIAETYKEMVSRIESEGGLLGGTVKMTEDELAQYKEIIKQLQTEFDKLKPNDGEQEKIKDKTDVFGMSVGDWKTLFENADGGLTAFEKMVNAAKAIGSAFSDVSDLMAAIEQRELKQFEKTQNKKKQALDKQLSQGLISQENYNARVRAIDEQTDAKREEMERKQAERQKMLAIFNAIISTAVAVAGALGSAPFGPWNIALAAVIGALGAVQIATIAATPLPGAEQGGMLIERAQDGKRYDATYEPNRRGAVSRPTVLVGENGTEYVVPADGYANPTIAPVLDIIESARRSGALKSLNLTSAMQRVMMPGRADGGSFSTAANSAVSKPDNLAPDDNDDRERSMAEQREMLQVLRRISERLDNPVPAKVAMTGSEGLARQFDKYNSLRDRSTIGRRKQS